MKLPARKRAGIVVAAVLGVDCVMHMFWASTGSSWPATTDKGLSRGLLNADIAFTPGVLFPLAAILLVATLMVLMRAVCSDGSPPFQRGCHSWAQSEPAPRC
jgi:hypothetical protein